MSIRTRLVAIAIPAVVGLGVLTASTPAHAAVNNRTVAGHCTQNSRSTLQVSREDTGKLSVDFGVDMTRHISGVAWKVKETNNGIAFVNTTKYTLADGSFDVSRLISPQPGTNTITASATNPATGETCTATASL